MNTKQNTTKKNGRTPQPEQKSQIPAWVFFPPEFLDAVADAMENRLDGWITDNAPEDVKAVRDLYWTAKFASVSAKQDGGDPMQNADFRNTLSAGLHAYLRLGGEVTLDGETLRSLKGARTM